MCYTPLSLKDGRTFSCGKCKQCHTKYIQGWVFRLQHELRAHGHKGLFVTLTYDYKHIVLSGMGKFTLYKPHYQDFLKRLRKKFPQRQVKYVVCGEYGSKNGRPHYHMLLFGFTQDDYIYISEAWGMGNVNIGAIEPASIAYVFKYAVKGNPKKRHWTQEREFVSMSKGLGETFAFDLQYENVQYINKKGNIINRKRKIRIPKPHFQQKIDTLLKMPYYVVPTSKGGTVKMSVPRFYLKSIDYDTTELTEQFLDKMQNKYRNLTETQKQQAYEREHIQRINHAMQFQTEIKHSIQKEKSMVKKKLP